MVCVDPCKKGLGKAPDHAIGQKKVQRKHCVLEAATWEMEDSMRLAHSLLVQFFQSTEGGASVVFYFVKLLITNDSDIEGGR